MAETKKDGKNNPTKKQKSIRKKIKARTYIRNDDLRTEIFLGERLDPLTITSAPIKVTHIPTGTSAIGKGQGTQVKNRKKAIELLTRKLQK